MVDTIIKTFMFDWLVVDNFQQITFMKIDSIYVLLLSTQVYFNFLLMFFEEVIFEMGSWSYKHMR